MEDILVKAAGFIFLILLGFTLKKIGLFSVPDAKVMQKVMIYVTLPSILINAFRDFKFDGGLFMILLIGSVANIVLMIIGKWIARNKDVKTKAIYMLSLGGYNIGSFSLPIIQTFFPASALINVVMFDIGNTIMCCGGTYSFAATQVKGEKSFTLKELGKNLVSAFPFDLYISLFILSLLNFKFPEPVYEVATIISGGNVVIVMLMLGMLFEVKLTSEARNQIWTIIFFRYLFATIFAVAVYYLTPFSLIARQVIILLLYSPITTMTTIFCSKLDCDHTVYGTVTSLTIPISIGIMMGLMILWNV